MKKALFLLFVFCATVVRAQLIPNPGFENWAATSGTNLLTVPFTGQRPLEWNTTDSIIQRFTGPISVYAGTDAYSGDSCIHLKTVLVAIAGYKVPGIASNGTLTFIQSPLSFQISGGTPDTSRSRKLIGQYKFSTTGTTDSAKVTVYKLRTDAGTGTQQLIASGVKYFTAADVTSAYTSFEIQLNYQNWTDQPDTCLIILQSGQAEGDIKTLPVTVGTELVIDDLSFTGFVGIEEAPERLTSFDVYPSPASDRLDVAVEAKDASERFNYRILDVAGKKLLEGQLQQGTDRLDVSSLAAGAYFLQLVGQDESAVAGRKFSVVR